VFNLKSAFSLLFAGRKQYPLPKATLACFLAAPGRRQRKPTPDASIRIAAVRLPISGECQKHK
jgi:hypothetical protein